MQASMIGSVFRVGHVGLGKSGCFAASSEDVIDGDVDPGKLLRLEQGNYLIYEPDLSALMQQAIATKQLSFTGDVATAISSAEILFIAVPPRPPMKMATPTSNP